MSRRVPALIAAALALLPAAPHAGRADSSGGLRPRDRLAGADGAALYADICQGCHMADARGAVGAGTIPALAGDPRLGSTAYPVYVVMHGLGGMPPVGGSLTDAEVARVVTYVTTHFGNHAAAPATPDDIARARLPKAWYTPSE